MMFSGRIWKDGKWWLAEAPLLDVMTQGRSRADARRMLADAIESIVGKDGFKVNVVDLGHGVVTVESDDVAALFAMALRRQRAAHGLTLRQVAGAMGEASITGYARYEQGHNVPSLDKAGERSCRAVSPDAPVVLGLALALGPRQPPKRAQPLERRTAITRKTRRPARVARRPEIAGGGPD